MRLQTLVSTVKQNMDSIAEIMNLESDAIVINQCDENDYKEVTFTESEEKYIREKYEDIVSHVSEIDSLISKTSSGWSLDRLGKVELTILRLATYEIMFDDDIPTGVAIDQAVELSKRFGRDESYAFINGVLAGLSK